MKIVTSGLSFLDIDAYAGCIAYAELLNLQGIKAVPYSSATFNESIPEFIRDWHVPFETEYTPTSEDTFILIDVSEPDFIEKNVDIERVGEVIDHHVGFEDFWAERIGGKSEIEFIGAACTLVFERWQKLNLLDQMSKISARLLVAGILDNTLSFKAGATTDRDVKACRDLCKIADISDDWTARYFTACETAIFSDLPRAIVNDMKVMSFKNLAVKDIAVGQLVVWDARRIISDHIDIVKSEMKRANPEWFMNIVSIREGRSYFVCSNAVETWAESVLNVRFEHQIARADQLWLRKEIVKQDLSM